MTAAEVMNIIVTVGVSQLVIDLLANYFIFKGKDYTRLLDQMERAKWNLDRAEADAAKNPTKNAKRLLRAQEEYSTHSSNVASKHNAPNLIGSIYFLILLRILGAEHRGQFMAVVPFVPLRFFQRVTARGLDWSNVDMDTAFEGITNISYQQGASFLFIYMLSALSVKFFVSQLVGTPPPPGADGGFFQFLQTPQGRRVVKSFGYDPDEFMKKE